MMSSSTSNLVIGFIQDLLVTGGSVIVGAMMTTGVAVMPTTPVIILAILTGAIQGARRAQSKVDPSVVERSVRPAEARTPQQLAAKAADREAAIAALVARLLREQQTTVPVPPTPTGGVVPTPKDM